jgi:hypothetical protein
MTGQGGDVPAKPTERASCATRKGISNLCFPRTDPTVSYALYVSQVYDMVSYEANHRQHSFGRHLPITLS